MSTTTTPPNRAYRASQSLEREAPMTAAGTRARHKDQANEWVAYTMVVLITILLGNLGEKIADRRNGVTRELPPELVAALEMKGSGGRPAMNPVTQAPRVADDPRREKELKATIAKNPEDLGAKKALAAYYYETLQADAAIALYQEILSESPDDVAIMVDLAAMQFVQGETAMSRGVLPKDMDENMGPVAAVATLMEAVEVDHTYAPALRMLGWAYSQIGQRQKAIEAYEHALEHTENSGERHAIEKLIEPLRMQAAAPTGAPGSTPELNPLTGTPILPRQPDLEQELMEQILNQPDNPGPHLNLGHYYYGIFEPAKAADHYESYLKKGGLPDPGVLTDYATVLSEVNLAKGIGILEKVNHDHPDFVPAWNNLAYLRHKGGDVAGAIAAMQEAYRHAPASEKARIANAIRLWGGTVPEEPAPPASGDPADQPNTN